MNAPIPRAQEKLSVSGSEAAGVATGKERRVLGVSLLDPLLYLQAIVILLLGMLIVYPAYILLVESFRGPSGGWSLTWYIQAYTSPRNLEAIVNTLIIACGTALFATMTGTGLAWAVVRPKEIGRATGR